MTGPAAPTGGTVAIRRADAADLPALNRLMAGSAAYRGRYRAMLDGYAISALQVTRDQIHLAEVNGTAAGFYSLITDPVPELDLMFVGDDSQGTGIGGLLFAHMRDLAASLGIAAVRIVSHPPAEGFYRRMGAVRLGTRPPTGRAAWPRPVLELRIGAAPRSGGPVEERSGDPARKG